jgi:hypothetical protein
MKELAVLLRDCETSRPNNRRSLTLAAPYRSVYFNVCNLVLVAIMSTALGEYGRAADTRNAARSPVLVELFTSEGCSSCPPADAILRQLDTTQPVAGAQVIVLSEHVDYWNHDGWKDPYSSALLTSRQGAYCRALRVNEPYTPQIIVDGTGQLQLSNPRQGSQIFEQAAMTPKIPVRIGSVAVDGTNPAVVRAHIEADDNSDENADIYAVVALNHAESEVLRGENSGQRLTHVAVVETLRKVGKLEKGKSFAQDVQMKLKPGMDAANIRVIAFVQESGPGKVLGAAMEKAPVK